MAAAAEIMPTRWTTFPRRPFGAALLGVLVLITAVAVALGAWGLARLGRPDATLLDDIYGALQLLALQGPDDGRLPWQLEIARFLAPVAGVGAVGQAVLLLVGDALDRVRARTARDHVVVAGLGDYGSRLADAFASRGDRVVGMERRSQADTLPAVRDAGVAVVVDDAGTSTGLRRAGIDRARYLVVTCGTDATNVHVAFTACAQPRQRGTLTTLVHVEELRLWPRLRTRALAVRSAGHRLEFFNANDTAARILLDQHPPFGRLDEREPHVLLVGTSVMAEMLVLHIARQWRQWPARRAPVRVTMVAADGRQDCARRLRDGYPALDGLVDLEPVSALLSGPGVARILPTDRDPPTAVYVCDPDETETAATGIALAERLPAGAPPVVVVVPDERRGLLASLQGGPAAVAGLAVFGVLDNALPPELLVRGANEILARAKHEQYVRAERARAEPSDGNPSLVAWSELPEALKESNRAFADRIGPKLTASGWALVPDPLVDPAEIDVAFASGEVDALAQMEHEGWCEALLRDGWRLDGSVKDPERKLHPLLVPWDELPEPERDKDREAVAAIPRILAEAGFRLFRADGG